MNFFGCIFFVCTYYRESKKSYDRKRVDKGRRNLEGEENAERDRVGIGRKIKR